jgi:hypothetical protein
VRFGTLSAGSVSASALSATSILGVATSVVNLKASAITTSGIQLVSLTTLRLSALLTASLGAATATQRFVALSARSSLLQATTVSTPSVSVNSLTANSFQSINDTIASIFRYKTGGALSHIFPGWFFQVPVIGFVTGGSASSGLLKQIRLPAGFFRNNTMRVRVQMVAAPSSSTCGLYVQINGIAALPPGNIVMPVSTFTSHVWVTGGNIFITGSHMNSGGAGDSYVTAAMSNLDVPLDMWVYMLLSPSTYYEVRWMEAAALPI